VYALIQRHGDASRLLDIKAIAGAERLAPFDKLGVELVILGDLPAQSCRRNLKLRRQRVDSRNGKRHEFKFCRPRVESALRHGPKGRKEDG